MNLLVPSGFLLVIDGFSFYLLRGSEKLAPFKMTHTLSYTIFLPNMNNLLLASGIPLISVSFAIYLADGAGQPARDHLDHQPLYLATTQPLSMPWWLHFLHPHCPSPRKCCPTTPRKGNKDLGLTPTHLPGLEEPGDLRCKVPGTSAPH